MWYYTSYEYRYSYSTIPRAARLGEAPAATHTVRSLWVDSRPKQAGVAGKSRRVLFLAGQIIPCLRGLEPLEKPLPCTS